MNFFVSTCCLLFVFASPFVFHAYVEGGIESMAITEVFGYLLFQRPLLET